MVPSKGKISVLNIFCCNSAVPGSVALFVIVKPVDDDDLLIVTLSEFSKLGSVGTQILLCFVQYGMLISVW